MKLLALSALLCALMALALAADAAKPEPQPEEAKAESAAVEKRIFDWGNSHTSNTNTNSGNTNSGNTDNSKSINKGNVHIGTGNNVFGNARGSMNWRAVEKRFFNIGNSHTSNTNTNSRNTNSGNTDNSKSINKGDVNIGSGNNRFGNAGGDMNWRSVEKRIFDWGNSHTSNTNTNSGNTNSRNTDNSKSINKGNVHIGTGNNVFGNARGSMNWRAVEKRFFNIGNSHTSNTNTNSRNTNSGNRDNSKSINKGHVIIGTGNNQFGNAGGDMNWRAVEKRFFNWGNSHTSNTNRNSGNTNSGNTDNSKSINKGDVNIGSGNNQFGNAGGDMNWRAVEKRFFNWGNSHTSNTNTNSGNTNSGNTDNSKSINKGNVNIGTGGNVFGNAGGDMNWRAMEKRTFCRPWRPRWTLIGHRYFLYIHRRLTWHQAERKCRRLGGHLASVHSAWEHLQIRNLIKRHNRYQPRAWIGGTDQHWEGHWKWTDGSCFNYHRWCCREPNNVGNEDCLEMNFSARKCWNDTKCHRKLPSVCVWNKRR